MTFELVLDARRERVGSFEVGRALPSRHRRAVGPFVFLDHMGPAELPPGRGADVGPHPHIGLATVTYLFAGEVVHHDSVGSTQPIRPGDVNWMTAGRGVVHSERSPPQVIERGGPLHGLQAWVALPHADEEMAPAFAHHPMATLPVLTGEGAHVRLIAGTAFGLTAPVAVRSPLLYADVTLAPGAALALPVEHAERAAYVVEGALVGLAARQLGVIATAATDPLTAGPDGARLMLLGGAPLDGPRHMWWNFVSSSPERIERAKKDWHHRRFPPIPSDDGALIPLPGT